jgi:hypothetical protein
LERQKWDIEAVCQGLAKLAASVDRLADRLVPPAPAVVAAGYVAERLGLTSHRIGQLARDGEIPTACVVPGTGRGKPWKFDRARIDDWIDKGRPQP